MLYLRSFEFPDEDDETGYIVAEKKRVYNTFYPFKVLSGRGVRHLTFSPITILYGGNGSGKTTALNVMAEKLALQRDALFNRSHCFMDYVSMCRCETRTVPQESRIITSDDVFDFMLDLRAMNEGIDRRRQEVFEEYLSSKYADFHYRTLEDFDRLKAVNHARRVTMSRFTRENLMGNLREQSNGESAFFYFTSRIKENGLYLLDEPENSLSPQRQIELARFMEDSARFFGCQFVVSTHSIFLLSLRDARIYDLDADPARVRKWTGLPAVRAYWDFLSAHREEIEGDEGYDGAED